MAVDPRVLRRGGFDRRFYVAVSIAAALIVFAGFARTYYLRGLFENPALTGLAHVHGVIMTLWIALFVTQAALVASGRTGLHRRLGAAGAVLAALVLVVGVATSIAAARRGASPGPPPLVFLVVPLGDMLVFAVLVGLGLWSRVRRIDVHRRLMLLSCLAILPAAIARIPVGVIQAGGPLAYFGLADLVVVGCVAADTIRHRRLHPAFAWGALFVIASHPLRLALGGTGAWMRFATWLAG